MLASLTHLCYPSKWESNYLRTYRCLAYDNFQFILLEEINCTLKINKLVIVIAPCPQMVIITAPIKGFLPKIKGGNCHIPISQKEIIEHFEILCICDYATLHGGMAPWRHLPPKICSYSNIFLVQWIRRR